MVRDRGVQLVAVALALQLAASAAALVGPWRPAEPARTAGPAVPGPADGVRTPGAVAAAAADVRLSASDVWDGSLPLVPLVTDASGALQVPATADQLGWWADGPLPGDEGAAVVVGHVDLDGRAGVLARLGLVRPGAVVVVSRPDGDVRFGVTSVARYAKDEFPTDRVYGPVSDAQLRLITCGGRFDRATGHYEDNVVVDAVRLREQR